MFLQDCSLYISTSPLVLSLITKSRLLQVQREHENGKCYDKKSEASCGISRPAVLLCRISHCL